MIIIENLGMVERRYSDRGVKLRQVETDTLWDDAVDVIPCQYSYVETDIPVEVETPEPDSIEQAARFLLGQRMVTLPEQTQPDYFSENEPEPNYFNEED